MGHLSTIERELKALNSLNQALATVLQDAMSPQQLTAIINKQLFSPVEDEAIAYWFARFINIRRNLWDVVNTSINNARGNSKSQAGYDWHYFVLAYSAICSLVRMDRFLVSKVAYDKIIQRKLNEAFPDHRIERKQYSEIYKALFLPANAIRIHQAHRTFKKQYKAITQAVAGDTGLQDIVSKLPRQERYIDLSWRRYFLSWLGSRRHAWRRRGASARQKSVFAVLEYSGRFAAEFKLPGSKKVTQGIRADLKAILQPGDIFITRHRRALTNLFLPGDWPHAALYIGDEQDRQELNIDTGSRYLKYWSGENCTFEALKDGVRFRTLDETLGVDAFVVIRPFFSKAAIREALARAVSHAGKGYNFDFDFFRSDHLVCTELIYRAFDGINGIPIPLKERMGRKTLSAEDILDLALDTDWGTAIAIFGVGDSKRQLLTGTAVENVLTQSYRIY